MNLASLFTLAGVLLLFHANKNNASSRYTCFPLNKQNKKIFLHSICHGENINDCHHEISLILGERAEQLEHFFVYKNNQYLSLLRDEKREFIFDQTSKILTLSQSAKSNSITKAKYNCQII